MTYKFKIWLINYSQFRATGKILDLYNPLDNKKLISTYFNLAALKLDERFKTIQPEYTRHIKIDLDFCRSFRHPEDILNFLLLGCKAQSMRRIKTRPIDVQIYPEDLFWEIAELSTRELDYKYPFPHEDDIRLIQIEQFDRSLLMSDSSHRYGKYRYIWK